MVGGAVLVEAEYISIACAITLRWLWIQLLICKVLWTNKKSICKNVAKITGKFFIQLSYKKCVFKIHLLVVTD